MKRNGNCTSNLVRFGRSRELCRSTVIHRAKRRKPGIDMRERGFFGCTSELRLDREALLSN